VTLTRTRFLRCDRVRMRWTANQTISDAMPGEAQALPVFFRRSAFSRRTIIEIE
jgi:hypothetical protein